MKARIHGLFKDSKDSDERFDINLEGGSYKKEIEIDIQLTYCF